MIAEGFMRGLASGINDRKDREERARAARAPSPRPANPNVYGALEAGGGPTRVAGNMMDLAPLIAETADELQMDPRDLATYMSYETAGTFDPRKKGPTTQWGQHEGFIQFGQPQQREYGVDLSSEEAAIRSQLGRKGAIVKYFRKNGWQPGMSFLDGYSIINAGAPGRHNASDANNGGAPGTVADKVRDQMAGHRAKAEAMFRDWQAPARPAPQRPSDASVQGPKVWGWREKYLQEGTPWPA